MQLYNNVVNYNSVKDLVDKGLKKAILYQG